jgi:predicted DNA-binding protein (MmcQ/YjbR family)
MSKAQFNIKHKEVLDTFLLDIPFVKEGKMYGHPAYYIGGKLFTSLYMEGVCVKIPEKRVKELLEMEGIVPFVPMGRKMKEWVLIVREHSEDYTKYKELFEESAKYVSKIAGLDIDKK